MKIKRLTPTAIVPVRAHVTDLGYDLFADQDVVLYRNESVKISTGIAIGFPAGFGGFIKDRSSMASKGLFTTGGVIDNGYIGEISVMLTNGNGNKQYIVQGDKIAQLVLIPVTNVEIEEVDSLEETDRGENGFGSTGN